MGTSNSFGGQKGGTPLIPSWLPQGPPAPPPPKPDGEPPPHPVRKDKDKTPKLPKLPPPPPERAKEKIADKNRFRQSRADFTTYAKSGGSDRPSLGRALSGYVSKSSGGPGNASKRMGSSRSSASKLLNFLNSVKTVGIESALRERNLESLIGQDIDGVFLGLSDFICPDGGNIDEGIARSAFIETIAELAEAGIQDLSALTDEQLQTIFESFATHAIEQRLCNDIGTKICVAPENIAAFEKAQDQLHDFIQRSVSDAITNSGVSFNSLNSSNTLNFVDHIYETSFSILQQLAEKEAQSDE